MSWVTIIWAMIASACLTLALTHVLVWWRRRDALDNLLFALSAVATAAFAGCELWMMRSETREAFGIAMRWTHLPAWALIVSLVGFVRLYLRAGRLWLAWTVCGLRTLSLILNFVFTPNLNYREITGLLHVSFLGETVAVAEGIPNPWMLIGQLSLLLFRNLCRGCRAHRLAAGRPASGDVSGWQHSFLSHCRDSAGNPGTLGNRSCADHNEFILYGYRCGDGLRTEPGRIVCGAAFG
jgi:hypothetical protein